MQVFIPCDTLIGNAIVLDRARLGKQRVECFQILNAIKQRQENDTHDGARLRGWINHPCTIMWEKYPHFLLEYAITITIEWKDRGYNDNMLPRFEEIKKTLHTDTDIIVPPWWGKKEVHISHQSRLLQKNFEHYSKFFDSSVPLTLDYVWM